MPRILITGASGMLGRYVKQQAEAAGYEVSAPTRAAFDLFHPRDLHDFIVKLKPEAVLHLAAETDVDLSERNPAQAGLLNHLATSSIAAAAQACQAWMLYVSTSSVFGDDGKILHNELDMPAPANYYGRSKFWGEKALERYCPANCMVVRAGWMIGGGAAFDHKFVGKIVGQITQGAQKLRAVGDRFGTITRAQSLANFIILSLKARRTGTFHYASEGSTSRLEIAKAIAEFMHFGGGVEAVQSAEFPLSAPRCVFEGINSIYLAREEDVPKPQHWRDDLRGYLAEFGIDASGKA